VASVRDIAVGSYELTPAAVWRALAGTEIDDELLERPPDRFGDWASVITETGRSWSAWVEDHAGRSPSCSLTSGRSFASTAETPLTGLTEAQDWRLCEAVLNLHAIADEACAGLGVALTSCDGYGAIHRARGRELLARKGSLSRAR